jgi:hypothetical protein
MNEVQLLDELVPAFGEPGDWSDVLRRAGRRRLPSRKLVLVAVVAVAAFVVGPALGVLLTRDAAPHLPAQADRSNVVVILQPVTGRVLLEAAPWKGHHGFCYLALWIRAGCVPHKARGTVVLDPPLLGWSFDRRIVSGTATTGAGKHLGLTVRHFGGRIDATFFLVRDRLPRLLRTVVLRDATGHVVARVKIR